MRSISNSGGMSLVELLIALALSAVAAGGIFKAYAAQQRAHTSQQQKLQLQQNLRAAMQVMSQEIMMAGFKLDRNCPAGVVDAKKSAFEFTLAADEDGYDNNNDGTIDESGELKRVRLELYDAYGDGDLDIGRKVGGLKRAIAENIEALEFQYIMADGSASLVPADPSAVQSVRVTLLARTAFEDRNFAHRKSYSTPGGQIWGPYRDHYRRRMMSSTVWMRNAGR